MLFGSTILLSLAFATLLFFFIERYFKAQQ